jgi:hypothetical protein
LTPPIPLGWDRARSGQLLVACSFEKPIHYTDIKIKFYQGEKGRERERVSRTEHRTPVRENKRALKNYFSLSDYADFKK